MPYHVSRGGQVYGPYTLEDLQRYVASGNIALSDLAKNEDLADWVPVSKVLGTEIPLAPTFVAPPAPNLPSPPDLHWLLVVLLSVVTCSIFAMIWNLVLASWFNKLQPRRNILNFYIVATVLYLVGSSFAAHWSKQHQHQIGFNFGMMLSLGVPLWLTLLRLSAWLARLFARFSFRSALDEHYTTVEPIGVRFDSVGGAILLFFFGSFYLQYKMNQINEAKRSLVAGGVIQP